jgi:hypothetical protein
MAIINQEKSSLPVELVYSFGGTDKFIQQKYFNDVEEKNHYQDH